MIFFLTLSFFCLGSQSALKYQPFSFFASSLKIYMYSVHLIEKCMFFITLYFLFIFNYCLYFQLLKMYKIKVSLLVL